MKPAPAGFVVSGACDAVDASMMHNKQRLIIMLIPHTNCMYMAMEITFNDLKMKHLEVLKGRWRLQERLRDKASALLAEYAGSLSLPSSTWADSSGRVLPYVEIGVWEAAGKFKSTPLAHLQMDENYALNFVIATTLDDNPMTGGHRHGVSISLRYESYLLRATIGVGDDAMIIDVSDRPGGFIDVCAAIKQIINFALDRAMPVGIPGI